jgi:hypothetical protein
MQAVRGLLVSAILIAMASAASAGPGTTTTTTTTPGTTTTTTTGPATTTTTGPTTTTTTGVPTTTTTTTTTTGVPTTTTTTTTTTAAPTTTTSTTTTTTTSTSTTTTTTLPSPTGENRYLHRIRKALDANNQLATDVGDGGFCIAGLIRGSDARLIPIRRVRFEYDSNGAVANLRPNSVKGEFSSVNLTVVIEEDGTGVVYQQSVTSACSLNGRVQKSGLRGKANLRCDLGSEMSALGLDGPANEQLRDNIENAFPKRDGNGININVEKGKLRVRHNGSQTTSGNDVTLSCLVEE